MRSRAISWLALLLSGGAETQAACPGPLSPLGEAARIGDRLEIELTDGRLVKSAGLAPFPVRRDGMARLEAARSALGDRLGGGVIEAPAPLPPEDRWGRTIAHLFHGGENLGAWLAGRGLVRADPAANDGCASLLLKSEAKARQAKLGLWADPYYAVIPAADPGALRARSGEFVVVEGRIFRLGQTSARFYLDFGPARGVDLSVTFSKQSARTFSRGGIDVAGLTGKLVRVRGIVEDRPGPAIEISSPHALEIIGR